MKWEENVDINEVRELKFKTTVFFGVGAINKINDIFEQLKKENINRVLLITGQNSYKASGAWETVQPAFAEQGIEYVHYDKVTANPTAEHADECAKLGKDNNVQAIIAIGGGSAIDIGKTVGILIKYPEASAVELYEQKILAEKALPIVAINLTHGTGTEVNKFAVASITEKQHKPAIGFDCIYPTYAINDPQLTLKLPKDQIMYVTLDALNHAIEAATTAITNPFSIYLAKEAVRLIAEYLPKASSDPEDLRARYYLMYASMMAGMSFDNGLLHFTHALEHPLSAMKPEVAHGHGLAALLPAVIKQIYPACPKVLADILSTIDHELRGDPSESEYVAKLIKAWFKKIGFEPNLTSLGFNDSDIPKLVKLVNETPLLPVLLSVSPIKATNEIIEQIYRDSL